MNRLHIFAYVHHVFYIGLNDDLYFLITLSAAACKTATALGVSCQQHLANSCTGCVSPFRPNLETIVGRCWFRLHILIQLSSGTTIAALSMVEHINCSLQQRPHSISPAGSNVSHPLHPGQNSVWPPMPSLNKSTVFLACNGLYMSISAWSSSLVCASCSIVGLVALGRRRICH